MPLMTRRRGLMAVAAATGAVATAVGLLLPTAAHADYRYQTRGGPDSIFLACVSSNCFAGGKGYVPRGRAVITGMDGVGMWSRTFEASCKRNNSVGYRVLRGRVIDTNWQGTWDVNSTNFVHANDKQLPWCGDQ